MRKRRQGGWARPKTRRLSVSGVVPGAGAGAISGATVAAGSTGKSEMSTTGTTHNSQSALPITARPPPLPAAAIPLDRCCQNVNTQFHSRSQAPLTTTCSQHGTARERHPWHHNRQPFIRPSIRKQSLLFWTHLRFVPLSASIIPAQSCSPGPPWSPTCDPRRRPFFSSMGVALPHLLPPTLLTTSRTPFLPRSCAILLPCRLQTLCGKSIHAHT